MAREAMNVCAKGKQYIAGRYAHLGGHADFKYR